MGDTNVEVFFDSHRLVLVSSSVDSAKTSISKHIFLPIIEQTRKMLVRMGGSTVDEVEVLGYVTVIRSTNTF